MHEIACARCRRDQGARALFSASDNVSLGPSLTIRAARGEEGNLWVGVMPSAPLHPFVPSTIREFQSAFPRLSLSLDECLKFKAIARGHDEAD